MYFHISDTHAPFGLLYSAQYLAQEQATILNTN